MQRDGSRFTDYRFIQQRRLHNDTICTVRRRKSAQCLPAKVIVIPHEMVRLASVDGGRQEKLIMLMACKRLCQASLKLQYLAVATAIAKTIQHSNYLLTAAQVMDCHALHNVFQSAVTSAAKHKILADGMDTALRNILKRRQEARREFGILVQGPCKKIEELARNQLRAILRRQPCTTQVLLRGLDTVLDGLAEDVCCML